MTPIFKSAMRQLFAGPGNLFDARVLFDPGKVDAPSTTAAFLLALGGDAAALDYLEKTAKPNALARFFLNSLGRVEQEIGQACTHPEFVDQLAALAENPTDGNRLWKVFFPEGTGLPETRAERGQTLREKRRVKNIKPNPAPLSDPGRELLFTSNVLLTIPSGNTSIGNLEYSDELKAHIRQAVGEKQRYWFDHPIQIGVEPEANEILYGLRGLN